MLFKHIINRIAICLQITPEVFKQFQGALSAPAFPVVKKYQAGEWIIIDPVITPVGMTFLSFIKHRYRCLICLKVIRGEDQVLETLIDWFHKITPSLQPA